MERIKDVLEIIYFASQIICSFVVVFGGIVAVWQYILCKKIEINQYHNRRIEKSIDLAQYYKDNILKYITYMICRAKAPDFARSSYRQGDFTLKSGITNPITA